MLTTTKKGEETQVKPINEAQSWLDQAYLSHATKHGLSEARLDLVQQKHTHRKFVGDLEKMFVYSQCQ